MRTCSIHPDPTLSQSAIEHLAKTLAVFEEEVTQTPGIRRSIDIIKIRLSKHYLSPQISLTSSTAPKESVSDPSTSIRIVTSQSSLLSPMVFHQQLPDWTYSRNDGFAGQPNSDANGPRNSDMYYDWGLTINKPDWMFAVSNFSTNVSFASLALFLPTIISEFGTFNRLTSNGLSASPYLLCFFLIGGVAFFSDKLRIRGPFAAFFANSP